MAWARIAVRTGPGDKRLTRNASFSCSCAQVLTIASRAALEVHKPPKGALMRRARGYENRARGFGLQQQWFHGTDKARIGSDIDASVFSNASGAM